MNNIKCAQCGLVSWSSEVECRRCGSLLTVQDMSAEQFAFDTQPEAQPLFSGALKFLTAILVLASVAFLLSRVFQLIDGNTAMMFAVIFMFSGMALLLLTHLWLLTRIFQESIGWGLGTLFIPLVGLFAIAKFWEKTRRSFLGQLICMGIILVGYQIAPPSLRPPSA